MNWLPIGPDFVFSPRNANYKRLSKRNERGRQGLAACIAIDQTDPSRIYNIERPSSGGEAAFKTQNSGAEWESISDVLKQTDSLIDPMWIDVNWNHPNVIYLATYNDRGLYISDDRGETWGAKKTILGKVRQFRVDPTTSADLANTHIIAACNNGVYYSEDSGDTWTKVANGDCRWISIHVPETGTAHYYAGIYNEGLFYTTDPNSPWTNLNLEDIGLPEYIAADAGVENNFTNLRIDICAKNPDRCYVWLAKRNQTEGIYTSDDPLASWTKIAAIDPPNPGQGFYNFEFAIAPNSPGDGANDIMLFGSVALFRSVDSGNTWDRAGIGFHADQQSFAFFPSNPSELVIPVCYVGCDGGIGRSTKFCDPAFDFAAAIDYHNESYQLLDTGSYENLNYAKQVSALYQYASHSDMNALSYIGCQDTGVNAGTKTMGWRGIADADGGAMAIAPGDDGVKLWGRMGAYGGFPSFRIVLWTDKGEFSPASKFVSLDDAAGALINGTSNYEITPDNECLVGAYVRDKETQITTALTGITPETFLTATDIVSVPGAQAVTPDDMTGINIDSVLTIDKGYSIEETVTVTATTVDTFSAIFTNDHNVNAKISHNLEVTPLSMSDISVGTVLTIDQGVEDAGVVKEETVFVTISNATSLFAVFKMEHDVDAKLLHNRTFASKIDQNGICHQISQDFGLINNNYWPRVKNIISHFTDSDLIISIDTDNTVWRTNAGSTADSTTVWNQVTNNQPANSTIYAVAITPDSHIYVLMRTPIDGIDNTGATINTPLFEISTDTWIAQPCNGLPASVGWKTFGKLVANPVNDNALYATHHASVYSIIFDPATGIWDFLDISDGLPSGVIYDLWVGFHSMSKIGENVILRAAMPTRGVWEKVYNQFGEDDSVKLYLRDHFMDQGLLSRSEDGVTNPYAPPSRLYHYKSADIKLDSRQPGQDGVADFFQTDPEDSLPISHVSFDKLVDNSRNLSASNQTMVHVQVRNRSTQPANNVYVWAIFCNASGGVPSLSKSASNDNSFDFWSQFRVTGEIIPSLPVDSPWTSVGSPVVLNSIDGFTPRIASWLWTTPTLLNGDAGHYCMAVFIHSAVSPINEGGYSVDYITPRNRQIGQKNLHIGEPLPADGSAGVVPGGSPLQAAMNEYIEFHNAQNSARNTTLKFEFNHLPEELEISLQFTQLNTTLPIEEAITGIHLSRPVEAEEKIENIQPNIFMRIFCWILNFVCSILNFILGLFGLHINCFCRRNRELPEFEDDVHEVTPGEDVLVEDIQTAAYGFDAAYIRIKNKGVLPEGSKYSFDILQLKNGAVMGGSEYVIRIAGDMKPFEFEFLPDINSKNYNMKDLHRLKRESLEQKYLPPWVEEEKQRREEEMGKD